MRSQSRPAVSLRTLLGRRLANREAAAERLGIWSGVAAVGLDGLGSAAYGPEAALTILAAAGAGGLSAIGPITWVILLLLGILYLSYRQTIAAYPNNGGSYTVARQNLGALAGLLAAASLMVDYMLNVAVGIAAGVAALTSALPVLHTMTLVLCLAILATLTWLNLRGARNSGILLAVPTYLFLLSLGGVLAVGVVRVASGHSAPVVHPPAPPHAVEGVGLWLLLRAFASGCSAMTGVEAVSNGVSAFKEPRVRTAHRVLSVIVAALALLLAGVAWLASHYGIMAMDQSRPGYQSVLSQLVAAVAGRGGVFYVTIASVLAVLCLSANTSFVGFPRLCRLVAEDRHLPAAFAIPGRRLVYSVGVLFLAGGSGALLVAFGGITDRLIPLFAVGAFASFTLSQAGMAAHWWRQGGWRRHIPRFAINLLGALATGTALAVILVAKFTSGAWLTVIVVPATVLLLLAIRRYSDAVERQALRGDQRRLDLAAPTPPLVLLPIERWDNLARRAVMFAVSLSPDVTALHVTETEGPDCPAEGEAAARARLRAEWERCVAAPARQAGLPPPALRIEPSPYRSLLGPLLRQILAWRSEQPGRMIAVMLPVLVEARWWEVLLHTHRERRLRRALLRDAGPGVMVVAVPWQLAAPSPQAALREEEPAADAAGSERRAMR